MKKLWTVSLLAVALSAAACSGDDDDDDEHAPTSVTIAPASVTLVSGTNFQMTATAAYEDGDTEDVTNASEWETTDGTVAAVSAIGIVTTNSAGTATISATHDEVTGTATVTVTTAGAFSFR